jgi:hypothetical protein
MNNEARMSLDTGRYQLFSSFKTLRAHWEEACVHWQDGIRQDFEEQYWNVLEMRINSTMAAIDRLGQIVTRARQECQ